MQIKGDHWTVRWYRGYVERGGFGRDPENLCRFLRVLLVWAPIRWFLFAKDKKDPPPCVYFLLVSFLTLMVGVISVGGYKEYGLHGVDAFVPSAFTLYFFGSVVLLIASLVVTSGLYKFWKEKYAHAGSGAFCPYIEVDGGLQLPVKETEVGDTGDSVVDEIIAEMEERGIRDVLADYSIVKIEGEVWVSQQPSKN